MTKSKPRQEVLKLEACKDTPGDHQKAETWHFFTQDQERDVWGRYVRHPFANSGVIGSFIYGT